MKAFFLLAGAAALGVAAPAAARPHHGHEHGHHHKYEKARYRAYQSHERYERHARHERRERYARRLARGQHYRSGYGVYYTYERIPYRIRHQYALNDRYRYYYSDGYLYQVDPRTMLIQQVISSLLR